MTDWVTIKIPKRTRNEAQDDPRTYEEIIQAGLDNQTVPENMLFDDWFEPAYAQTIAEHIKAEIEFGNVEVALSESERKEIAERVAQKVQR